MRTTHKYLFTEDGVIFDEYIDALQQQVDGSTGKMDAIVKMQGGHAISFTLEPRLKVKPRKWWQVWRKK